MKLWKWSLSFEAKSKDLLVIQMPSVHWPIAIPFETKPKLVNEGESMDIASDTLYRINRARSDTSQF